MGRFFKIFRTCRVCISINGQGPFFLCACRHDAWFSRSFVSACGKKGFCGILPCRDDEGLRSAETGVPGDRTQSFLPACRHNPWFLRTPLIVHGTLRMMCKHRAPDSVSHCHSPRLKRFGFSSWCVRHGLQDSPCAGNIMLPLFNPMSPVRD